MRKTAIAVCLGILVCLGVSGAFAGTIQDVAVNNNGTFADGVDITSSPFSSTIDPTTGLGTITYTDNPGAAGSFFTVLAIDYEVGIPFWNEYGGTSGSASAGETWQIDASFTDQNFAPTIWTNTQNNTLDNTNHVPGTLDNFDGVTCSSPNCNTDVAVAMGFAYVLAPNQEAVISFSISDTQPDSGYLFQTHPADAANDAAQTVYFTGGVSILPTGGQVPEPASWLLVGSAALLGLGAFRRKTRVRG